MSEVCVASRTGKQTSLLLLPLTWHLESKPFSSKNLFWNIGSESCGFWCMKIPVQYKYQATTDLVSLRVSRRTYSSRSILRLVERRPSKSLNKCSEMFVNPSYQGENRFN